MSEKMSRAQQRVWDALADGYRLRYWPPIGMGHGHFSIVAPDGDYDHKRLDRSPPIPHTTIPAMEKKGFLVCVRRFNADATSSGLNAAKEFVRAAATGGQSE